MVKVTFNPKRYEVVFVDRDGNENTVLESFIEASELVKKVFDDKEMELKSITKITSYRRINHRLVDRNGLRQIRRDSQLEKSDTILF